MSSNQPSNERSRTSKEKNGTKHISYFRRSGIVSSTPRKKQEKAFTFYLSVCAVCTHTLHSWECLYLSNAHFHPLSWPASGTLLWEIACVISSFIIIHFTSDINMQNANTYHYKVVAHMRKEHELSALNF